MANKGKLKFGHYYTMVFILLFCFFRIRGCVIEKDVENSKIEVIAKFVKIEKSIKTIRYEHKCTICQRFSQ